MPTPTRHSPTKAVAFRIPSPLREDAQKRARERGVSLAFVVKNALAEFAYGAKTIELAPSPAEAAAILKAARDADAGIGVHGPFRTAQEMIAHLHAVRDETCAKK